MNYDEKLYAYDPIETARRMAQQTGTEPTQGVARIGRLAEWMERETGKPFVECKEWIEKHSRPWKNGVVRVNLDVGGSWQPKK